jgi:hypothetical protein
VLDALVDRQDRQVAGTGETTMVVDRFQAAKHSDGTVAQRPDATHEIGSGQVQVLARDRLGTMLEQVLGVVAEDLLEAAQRGLRGRGHP